MKLAEPILRAIARLPQTEAALSGRLAVMAMLVGGLVGTVTQCFVWLIGWLETQLWTHSSEHVEYFSALAQLPQAWRVAVPVLAGLVVGGLVYLLPGRRYHGVSDVMEAVVVRGGRLDVRSGLGAATAAVISLGGGASLGREGPAVHIGASMIAYLAERLRLNRNDSMILIGCAAAAAVSTSFNAPIAGTLFALEVIIGFYAMRVFIPLVLATMSAYLITGRWPNAEAIFAYPEWSHAKPSELLLIAVLGILGGITVKFFLFAQEKLHIFWRRTGLQPWLRPAVAGLGIGILALWVPQVLGTGTATTQILLLGDYGLGVVVAIFLGKIVATLLSISSGFCGGVFGPMVVIGAAAGGAFATLMMVLGWSVSAPLYAVSGMAAVAAATLGAPISTLLMAFELTRDYDVVTAVMTAVAGGSLVMLCGRHRSLFRWQLAAREVDLTQERDLALLRGTLVGDLVEPLQARIRPDTLASAVSGMIWQTRAPVFVAADADNHLLAWVEPRQWQDSDLMDDDLALAVARMQAATSVMTPEHSLSAALDAFSQYSGDYLPICARADGSGYLGVLSRPRLWQAIADQYAAARAREYGIN